MNSAQTKKQRGKGYSTFALLTTAPSAICYEVYWLLFIVFFFVVFLLMVFNEVLNLAEGIPFFFCVGDG